MPTSNSLISELRHEAEQCYTASRDVKLPDSVRVQFAGLGQKFDRSVYRIDRLQRQVDTLSTELAKWISEAQREKDRRNADEPKGCHWPVCPHGNDCVHAQPPAAALELVHRQAADEGLWFQAQTASEGYLQQELRKLHAAIEGEQIEFKGPVLPPRVNGFAEGERVKNVRGRMGTIRHVTSVIVKWDDGGESYQPAAGLTRLSATKETPHG